MSNVQAGGPMRFYSAGEVAGMFGVSRMTIYRAINDGTIPAIQVRDRWVVPALAVEAMVQAAIARAEALVATRPPDDDVGSLDRYMDRPRPGAKHSGAGSPVTQQGARGEVSRMAYSASGARAAGGAR
jgi:excisionase family DNA binding protein